MEIVRQRCERIKKTPIYRPADKREFALAKTLSTIYGVDIASDNIAECKKRILDIVFCFAPKKPSAKFLATVNDILTANILLGDMLNGKEKITFTEWNFLGAEYMSRTIIKKPTHRLLDMEAENDPEPVAPPKSAKAKRPPSTLKTGEQLCLI